MGVGTCFSSVSTRFSLEATWSFSVSRWRCMLLRSARSSFDENNSFRLLNSCFRRPCSFDDCFKSFTHTSTLLTTHSGDAHDTTYCFSFNANSILVYPSAHFQQNSHLIKIYIFFTQNSHSVLEVPIYTKFSFSPHLHTFRKIPHFLTYSKKFHLVPN